MIYVLRKLCVGLVVFTSMSSQSIAQEDPNQPHVWCNALTMKYSGGEYSKVYIDEFANSLDRKFDLKGFSIEEAEDSSALVHLLENNEVDFAVIPEAVAVESERLQVIWSDPSGQRAIVASPKAYEMGYAHRELLSEAATLELPVSE